MLGIEGKLDTYNEIISNKKLENKILKNFSEIELLKKRIRKKKQRQSN